MLLIMLQGFDTGGGGGQENIGRNKEDLSGRVLRQSFNMHLKWIIKDIYLTLGPSPCFFKQLRLSPPLEEGVGERWDKLGGGMEGERWGEGCLNRSSVELMHG